MVGVFKKSFEKKKKFNTKKEDHMKSIKEVKGY